MYLTYDCETMDADEKLIFDIGLAVHDIKGNVKHKTHFLIDEIYNDIEIMDMAYYKKNIPIYEEMLKNKKINILSWYEFVNKFRRIIKEFDINTICAYNLRFDLHALFTTHNYVHHRKMKPRNSNGVVITQKKVSKNNFYEFSQKFANENIFTKEMNYECIYIDMATPKLLATKDYVQTAINNEWLSEKKKVSSSAECAYRYITNDYNFVEAHTSLEDVLIEVELFKKCQELPIAFEGSCKVPWKVLELIREENSIVKSI